MLPGLKNKPLIRRLGLSSLSAAVQSLINGAVQRTGDTMTGPLTLSGNVSGALQAVPLQQVQALAASALSFSALTLSATGANANVAVGAAELLLRGADGSPRLVSSINLTLNTAASGVNGLDTGALAASTWYAVWVISNGTTTAALASLSATAPTMPAGYTHKARVGWIRTDGTANKWPLAFVQRGARVQYAPTSSANITAYPQIAQSNVTLSRTAVSVTSAVPSTAAAANITVFAASASTPVGVALYANATAPAIGGLTTPSGVAQVNAQTVTLESTSIYWDLVVSSGGANLYVNGWGDNL